MSEPRVDLLTRLGRPLRGVIGVVAAVGIMAALLVDPEPDPVDAARAAAPGAAGAPALPGDPVAPTAPVSSGAPAPGGGAAGPPALTPPTGPGLSAVPVPGVYRYRVEATRDGITTVEQEEREITQLSGDRRQGTVQIVARLGDERQVSVIDWSPTAALVRSTRIETGSAVGQDCAWEPPFPELGALGAGSSWEVSSTCRSDVAGIPTTFEVSGGGRVVEAVTVGDVPAWRIERTRTTRITAALGGDQLSQRVEERSTIFFDPARGVAVRSESVIVTDGRQRGRVERVSVLQG